MYKKKSDKFVKLLLGTVAGEVDQKIKECKLSTNKQVLLSLLANLNDRHWDQALSATIDNVPLHCEKACIPTLSG